MLGDEPANRLKNLGFSGDNLCNTEQQNAAENLFKQTARGFSKYSFGEKAGC
jgi:hypothetical protein